MCAYLVIQASWNQCLALFLRYQNDPNCTHLKCEWCAAFRWVWTVLNSAKSFEQERNPVKILRHQIHSPISWAENSQGFLIVIRVNFQSLEFCRIRPASCLMWSDYATKWPFLNFCICSCSWHCFPKTWNYSKNVFAHFVNSLKSLYDVCARI